MKGKGKGKPPPPRLPDGGKAPPKAAAPVNAVIAAERFGATLVPAQSSNGRRRLKKREFIGY